MSSCVWVNDSPRWRGLARGLLCAAALAGVVVVSMRPPAVALVDEAGAAAALDRQITATFGMERPLVWILQARQGSIWTTEGLTRVQELTRAVLRIPGVIAPDVVSLGSPNLRDLRVSEGGLEPVYLMGRVPDSPEKIARLRKRVESDPMFRGSLTSLDGTAAMIVANFRTDLPNEPIAQAALELRDRFEQGSTRAFVVGPPVAAAMAANATPVLAVVAVVAVGIPLALLFWWIGFKAAGASLLTGAAAAGLTLVGAWQAGALVLPWVLFPVALAGAVAGRAAQAPPERLRGLAAGCAGGMIGFAVFAMLCGEPARAFAAAGLFACAAAGLCGWLGQTSFRAEPLPPRGQVTPGRRRALLAVLLVAATAGAARLQVDFSLAGYGARYLPRSATRGLEALDRLFPPPTFLVMRIRGEPGFVASPAVLGAFDHVRERLEKDPAVRQVTSLADLVKLVNRSFNEGRDEYFSIPEDHAMVARYLALAYSPGFRRFVDRAQASAAVWIALDSSAPRDLQRVADLAATALHERPVPGAQVDMFGGDGAQILEMAQTARDLAMGSGLVLLSIRIAIAIAAGTAAGLRATAMGLASGLFVAGTLGWLGHRIDLVTLPTLLTVALGGALWSQLSMPRPARAHPRPAGPGGTP